MYIYIYIYINIYINHRIRKIGKPSEEKVAGIVIWYTYKCRRKVTKSIYCCWYLVSNFGSFEFDQLLFEFRAAVKILARHYVCLH